MRDITPQGKSKLVETSKLTTVGGAAIAIIFMQMIAFNAAMDALMSAAIFGAGYLACWIRK